MLSKLSLRNAKRSIKDYVIYLITVTLALSLMFTFNLVSFSKEIIDLSSVMENFKTVMYVVNVFIVLVVCFLINYTIKFMFSKRSLEFGTYMILGIKKKTISNLFTLENVFLGLISLFLSIPLGFLFSQFASAIVMQLFSIDHIVGISFRVEALLLSLLYFGIIYLIVLFLARLRIKKMKVYDLIYFEHQNEKQMKKSKKLRTFLFLLSLIIGVTALVLFDLQFTKVGEEPSMVVIFASILMIMFSIYGTMITFSDFLLHFVLKRKNIKYQKDHLFVARTFYSKIKSMSFTMGTLTILITFTLVSLNLSSLFKGMFDYQIDLTAPYDISVSSEKEKIEDILTFIKKEYHIQDMHVYDSYEDGHAIKDVINKKSENCGWREFDHLITLSDYNKLLRLRGLEEESLKEDEYILHVTKEYKDFLENEDSLKYITLSNGKVLKQKKFLSKNYSYAWGSGYGYLLVVPDDAVINLQVINTHLVVNTKEKTTETFYNKLTEHMDPEICRENEEGLIVCYSLGDVIVRGAQEAQNNGFVTITSFICFYIAFIFTAVVGTIFAIQSLSDSTKYKYRYTVLKKLGVRQNDLYKTVQRQLSFFFLIPLIYPIIISFVTLQSMNKIFKIALASDQAYIGYYVINLGIFLLIYGIYLLATYFGFKKNIDE